MGAELPILLIALSVALATYGAAQWVLMRGHSDRQRLADRLTADWRADLEAIRKRNLTVETDVRGVPLWLAIRPIVIRWNRRLLSVYPQATFRQFLYAMGACALPFGLITGLLFWSPVMALPGAMGGAYVPVLFLMQKRSARQKLIGSQIPEALDFLCRIVKAGHSLSTAIMMMGDELAQPIGGEFRRCYDQHSLGQPIDACLRDMATRIDSGEFAFFITSMLVQRSSGGDLTEVLGNLSATVRARIRFQDHVRAVTAEGRLTGYILVAFPLVLFLISYALNPKYASVLITDPMGKMLVGAAFLFQMVGLYSIRRIVNIKV